MYFQAHPYGLTGGISNPNGGSSQTVIGIRYTPRICWATDMDGTSGDLTPFQLPQVQFR